jgi:crotonobetainyl-CoA:carnitine CoA-transferase CaiB-like acyl-CoA transferase
VPVPKSENQPLTGIRVVEIAGRIAGPFAARVLAEAGADVVKVEPIDGDPARRTHAVGFSSWNRSKRATVLDLERPSGSKTLHALLARADILVHDLPPSDAARLGLDDAAARIRHPHLIVGSVPAFPTAHPDADEPAIDSLVQAAAGFMDEQQGNRPGPVYVRLPYPSWCAAYMLATGVLARLAQRERTGVVAPVSTSLFQGGLAPSALFWSRWDRLPPLPPGQTAPLGNGRPHTLPKIWPDAALSIFGCADGQWVQLAGAVGGWIESPPVLESLALSDRVELSEIGVTPENREEWSDVFRTRTAADWIEAFRSCDVPCVISRFLGDCFTLEQVTANGYVVEVDDPQLGVVLQAGPPVTTVPACVVRGPAPALGSTVADAVIGEWSLRAPPAPQPDASPSALPLAGLNAVDFGATIAGPFGALCLRDLGAEVIKVEPITGDRGRSLTQWPPSHRGKRAIAVDLKTAEGHEIAHRLVQAADIVLHNMRLRAACRLGIDGDGLRAINPSVVFSHVTAYGSQGPWSEDPGYDPTAQAVTGWEHANAGEGMPPIWLRNSVFDVMAGLASCMGAVLGLVQLQRNGTPGESQTSLLAAGITTSSELAIDLASGRPTPVEVLAADQTGVSPRQRIYALRDGWVAVAALDVRSVEALDAALGSEDGREERLADAALEPTLRALLDAGVPAARVALDQMDAFFDSDINRTLGQARRLQTSGYGQIEVVGGFWSLGADPRTESIPDFGEHSLEVLTEIGLSSEEIDDLFQRRIVAARKAPVGVSTGGGTSYA